MSATGETSPPLDGEASPKKQGWLATGGLVGAMLASTCCLGPLVLLSLGISGAWIGNLTALEPYKPAFATTALILIGLGFRQVYFRPKATCEAASYCVRPAYSVLTQAALWIATVLVILALTVDWWAPLLY